MEMTSLVFYKFFRMFEYALTAETAYSVTHGPFLPIENCLNFNFPFINGFTINEKLWKCPIIGPCTKPTHRHFPLKCLGQQYNNYKQQVNNYKFLPHKRTKSSKLQHETPSYDIIKWFQLPKEAFYLWKWLFKNVLFTQFMPLSEQIWSNSLQTQLTVGLSFHVLKNFSLIFIAVLKLPNECYYYFWGGRVL